MQILPVLVMLSAAVSGDSQTGQCTRGCTYRPVSVRHAYFSRPQTPVPAAQRRMVATLADGSVRIVGSNPSIAEKDVVPVQKSVTVTCDEIQVNPRPTFAVRFSGNVVVKTKRFTAHAEQVTSAGSMLVLESDGLATVQLIASAAGADQQQPLTMSAKRITVDLARNHFTIEASEQVDQVVPIPEGATAVTASKP